MKLTHSIVQPFITAFEEAFPYRVTITDVDGYIIGSSDPDRLNQFHASAYEIISGRGPIEKQEQDTYVNLPDGVVLGFGERILFNGECIGLIGLVGPPQERKKDIKTAQFVLRLFLEREQSRAELELAMADRNAFIVRLLQDVNGQEKWLEKRAQLYGIDLYSPRHIAVVNTDLRRFNDMQPMELSGIKSNISETVRGVFADSEDLIYETATGEIVIMTVSGKYRDAALRERALERMLNQLCEQLKKLYHVPLRIGISRECETYHEFSGGYQQALLAAEIGKRVNQEKELCFFEQMRLERIVAGFSNELRHILTRNIIDPLRQQPELMETLAVYFGHNMNVVETAERLFVHRNTLQYRFKQIKKLTGYDVRKVDDLIQLRLAVLQLRIFEDK